MIGEELLKENKEEIINRMEWKKNKIIIIIISKNKVEELQKDL